MRKITILSLLLIVFSFATNAQIATGQLGKNFGAGSVVQSNSPEIQGSYYYSDDWMTGNVRSIDQKLFENLTFKYNLKDQSLIIKLENDQVKIVKNRFINDFEFTDKFGKVHQFGRANTYNFKGRSLGGFVEIIHQGDFDLVYRHTSKFKPAEARPNYGSTNPDPEYIKQVDLLSATDGKELTAVRNKKELLTLFNDKASEMKKYFKENKVKLRNFESMVNTVEHYKGL